MCTVHMQNTPLQCSAKTESIMPDAMLSISHNAHLCNHKSNNLHCILVITCVVGQNYATMNEMEKQ